MQPRSMLFQLLTGAARACSSWSGGRRPRLYSRQPAATSAPQSGKDHQVAAAVACLEPGCNLKARFSSCLLELRTPDALAVMCAMHP